METMFERKFMCHSREIGLCLHTISCIECTLHEGESCGLYSCTWDGTLHRVIIEMNARAFRIRLYDRSNILCAKIAKGVSGCISFRCTTLLCNMLRLLSHTENPVMFRNEEYIYLRLREFHRCVDVDTSRHNLERYGFAPRTARMHVQRNYDIVDGVRGWNWSELWFSHGGV